MLSAELYVCCTAVAYLKYNQKPNEIEIKTSVTKSSYSCKIDSILIVDMGYELLLCKASANIVSRIIFVAVPPFILVEPVSPSGPVAKQTTPWVLRKIYTQRKNLPTTGTIDVNLGLDVNSDTTWALCEQMSSMSNTTSWIINRNITNFLSILQSGLLELFQGGWSPATQVLY